MKEVLVKQDIGIIIIIICVKYMPATLHHHHQQQQQCWRAESSERTTHAPHASTLTIALSRGRKI